MKSYFRKQFLKFWINKLTVRHKNKNGELIEFIGTIRNFDNSFNNISNDPGQGSHVCST
jgi:hypothetical protein